MPSIKLNAIRKLCKNIKKIGDGNKLVHATLQNTSIQQDIIALNTEDQLYNNGITADGLLLGDYSPFTVKQKEEKGQRHDHITLNDTGIFYKSFDFKNNARNFVFSADTMKGAEANPDFGKIIQLGNGKFVQSSVKSSDGVDLMTYGNIIGLTKQNKGVVSDWIKPMLVEEIKKSIFK
jgi:hypothetical protein